MSQLLILLNDAEIVKDGDLFVDRDGDLCRLPEAKKVHSNNHTHHFRNVTIPTVEELNIKVNEGCEKEGYCHGKDCCDCYHMEMLKLMGVTE